MLFKKYSNFEANPSVPIERREGRKRERNIERKENREKSKFRN
jgi:hypothetical protein